MEALNDKRARLRDELRQAYGTWISVSERQTTPEGVDISGPSDATRERWLEYLAAEEGLVPAYAEQPLAA